MFCLVNEQRKLKGLAPYTRNAILDQQARAHAQASADIKWWTRVKATNHPHDNPQTGSHSGLANQGAGYCPSGTWSVGENATEDAGPGRPTPRNAVAWWALQSPEHRDAMLSATFKETGFGVVAATPVKGVTDAPAGTFIETFSRGYTAAAQNNDATMRGAPPGRPSLVGATPPRAEGDPHAERRAAGDRPHLARRAKRAAPILARAPSRAGCATARVPRPCSPSDPARPGPRSAGMAYTIGLEEQVMVLDPACWALVTDLAPIVDALPRGLTATIDCDGHAPAVELRTAPHAKVGAAIGELGSLRGRLTAALGRRGLRAAVAGAHPAPTRRSRCTSTSRSPTTPAPADARPDARHLPLLVALSGNSPFVGGRETGCASARIDHAAGEPVGARLCPQHGTLEIRV